MPQPSERILQVLVPELPRADALLPWLARLDAGRRYSNFGPLCRELEDALAHEFAGEGPAPHVTSCCNGTLALELALRASGLAAGSRVLTPALTFPASALATIRAGLEPVFADVDADNLQLTPGLAHDYARHTRIDAVMPVAAFGAPCPAAPWDSFAEQSGTPVIIDAAGAFGNQAPLRHGTVVFSLHATKALAAGEGGFVVSHDETLARRVRQLSNFGFEEGQCIELGTNAKLSEYHAAAALAGLAAWPNKKRRLLTLRAFYREVLAAHCPQAGWPDRGMPIISTVLPVLLPDGHCATEVATRLELAGIQTRRWYWPALHRQPAFAPYRPDWALTVTDQMGERLLGLPFHLSLEPVDVERVAIALRAAMHFR